MFPVRPTAQHPLVHILRKIGAVTGFPSFVVQQRRILMPIQNYNKNVMIWHRLAVPAGFLLGSAGLQVNGVMQRNV
jgi:hypothetical protein